MANFDTLDLYMFGPQEMSKTVTAVKLLNARRTGVRALTLHSPYRQ